MPRGRSTRKSVRTAGQKPEFMYCSNWKCPNEGCRRHHVNQPWEVVTIQQKWIPDKDGRCEAELYE